MAFWYKSLMADLIDEDFGFLILEGGIRRESGPGRTQINPKSCPVARSI